MNQQDPNIPFNEDPTQKELTAYTTFTKLPETRKFCDHFREDESVYKVEDEISENKAVRKANKIHVVKEDVKEGEGLIERKDLYTVCHNVLGENGQNLRGYWEIEVKYGDMATSFRYPVFQFGPLGLEVRPKEKGIIRSVQRIIHFSQLLARLTLTYSRLGTRDVEIILRSCLKYEEGKTIMEKLSGSGISDGKILFRWCLRGPRIDRETHAQPFYKRVLKKSKSFFQINPLKGLGKKTQSEVLEDDG